MFGTPLQSAVVRCSLALIAVLAEILGMLCIQPHPIERADS